MPSFAFLEEAQVNSRADAIPEELLDMATTDPKFQKLSSGTDTAHKARYRAEEWSERLHSLVTSDPARCRQ